jgi:heme exporter protein B
MNFWGRVLAIARKDIISELRTREIFSSVLVFAILVLVIFNFAFAGEAQVLAVVAPGILWVAFAFSGVLALNRAFIPEKEENCLEGLMGCPVGREVIFLGKAIGSLCFMLMIEAVILPVFALFFNLPVLSLPLLAVTLAATRGFVAVGTLFSALAVNTRAREMVLPILFLPIVVPVVICAVEASAIILSGGSLSDITGWLAVILAFDAIFLTVPWLIFPYVIEE